MTTVLCLASYFKGEAFLQECRRLGARVLLVTLESLKHEPWPADAVDEFLYMPSLYNRDDLVKGISWLARSRRIDRIVPLDDYDVELAAILREHLRIPGMGDTTARHFRDKLAMRVKADADGIPVPDFVHVLNYDTLREWMGRVPGPWVIKPRSEASAIGIKKIFSADELWPVLDRLGDRQSFYLMERFVPGDVYHVDSITSERRVVFAAPHKYGHPPMKVAHEGGIFSTVTISRESPEAAEILALNERLVASLGLVRGVMHTEFIRGAEDGRFYFLETAARVGGAFIAELVEAATGINLWAEWAKIEIAGGEHLYEPPPPSWRHAGLLLSLARQEWPDTSAYADPEVVRRLVKKNHAGLIVASADPERVRRLVDDYMGRFGEDFLATLPLPEKPTS